MRLNLLPTPKNIACTSGVFRLERDTRILHSGGGAGMAGELARKMRPATGFPLPVEPGQPGVPGSIALCRCGDDAQLGQEGYRLHVTPEYIEIIAPEPAGLLYGIQTLLQLLPHWIVSEWRVPRMDALPGDVVLPAGWRAPAWEVPCVTIEDAPRFAWRGLMIDCSRHFMPVPTLLWCMDKMVQLKMNRLHLHLSDNHGWRIEIPRWPLLTEVGARVEPEPRRHGFYTANDIRRLVEYAAERHIVIVPEIDVPGHIFAAVTAYPELCCSGTPRRNDMSHWHQLDILCAGQDKTCGFLEDVFGHIMTLFPGPYVHVGGDEAPKVRWRACPKCQERMRRENLANEAELQAWMIGRICELIRTSGRRAIAWDDVLAGHPQNDVIIHWWQRRRGNAAALEGVRRGHQVICSRGDWCYYTPWQGQKQLESFYREAEYLPLEFRDYRHEGFHGDFGAPAEWQSIIGAQGCMWTEETPPEMVPARLFPAILAHAELQWSYVLKSERDLPAFEQRALSMSSFFEGFAPLNWGS